jgi:branched-chain amino acid transport system ATP-binding protein
LNIFYQRVHAVQNVSLAVPAGQIVTLIGANGAGKTSILKAISGLVRPTSGAIEFAGESVVGMSPHDVVHRGISHVPEGRRIFPNLTVMENLRLGAYHRGNHKELGEDLAKVFHRFPVLHHRRSQGAGTLSGGEQQMLAISRAMVSRPRLLILDEPSLGLAPVMVDAVFDVIQSLNQEGMTVLLVEQNATMALELAHHAYVLETGRISMAGPAAELLNDSRVKQAYLGE